MLKSKPNLGLEPQIHCFCIIWLEINSYGTSHSSQDGLGKLDDYTIIYSNSGSF